MWRSYTRSAAERVTIAVLKHYARDHLPTYPSAALDIIRGVRHFSREESPERIAASIERLLRS